MWIFKFFLFFASTTFPEIVWGPIQNLSPIRSAVLTFIGYKNTSKVYKNRYLILFCVQFILFYTVQYGMISARRPPAVHKVSRIQGYPQWLQSRLDIIKSVFFFNFIVPYSYTLFLFIGKSFNIKGVLGCREGCLCLGLT